jgi:hypothetical protein
MERASRHTHCRNRLQPHASLLKASILHLNLVEYPDYRSVLGCAIIAITHANCAEIATRKPYSPLLDELDKIVLCAVHRRAPIIRLTLCQNNKIWRPLRIASSLLLFSLALFYMYNRSYKKLVYQREASKLNHCWAMPCILY